VLQALTDNCIITKIQYSPTTRVPINQQHDTTGRPTSLKPSTGSSKDGKKDTTPIVEPVANAEYTNKAGELNGKGSNSLNEEEMSTPNQRAKDHLLNIALKIKGAREWAEEEIEREKLLPNGRN
jgi:hypothetical protein